MRSLYLDTARLGQTSPSALKTQLDFARLTAEEPSSLYFEKFLRDGCSAWPESYLQRFPALSTWHGIAELKQTIRGVVSAPDDAPVLLANRSAQLTQLSAGLLFRLCRNVLTTDTCWPSYHALLTRAADRTGSTVTTVPVRQCLLEDRATHTQIIDRLAGAFVASGCDGLFLPAIDNLGNRIPITETVEAIQRKAELRFVVVDGAQTFCHAPFSLRSGVCDIFIAGCHKWLRSYHPMGIAIAGRKRSHDIVARYAKSAISSFDIDDPLLRFTQQLESNSADGYSETVNITSMLSCRSALQDRLVEAVNGRQTPTIRRWNADGVASAVDGTGWSPLRPTESLRTGILLLQNQRASVRDSRPDVIRQVFQNRDLILTAYDDGVVRLSMPDTPMSSPDLDHICETLAEFN